jgi:sugar O-acyltransferase (sialic acid O-acetyltransferase NeuD family)
MTKQDLIIVGAGGHALSCIDVIEQQNKFSIAGLVGLEDEIGSIVNGYKVIAADSELPELAKIYPSALVTVGQIRNVDVRISLFQKCVQAGFSMATVISPNAYVSLNAQIGEGSIIMHGVIINSSTKVGNNCIINSQALIEHGSSVGDNSHISTGVIVNGDVKIGKNCFIGSGSVIKESISIGSNCLIGMGQIIKSNVDKKMTVTENNKL